MHDFVGNIRRFRRVCEHIQAQVCTRRPPPSPRAQRKFTTELSESSSCGSDSSELFLNTRQVHFHSMIESKTELKKKLNKQEKTKHKINRRLRKI
ncbi:unnamed protein product [Diabrotica balteata]|uniref:Uncharacterized protein n=1 Tax=Diabrotica balteata TaxID=107213 RepID=A0A9N9X8A4_DIABA|nr:unnamed protein product [Diabrotica balteata]